MDSEMRELINVLKDISQSLKEINENNSIKMLTAKDISEKLKVNVNTATEILKRDDIPSIRIGKLKIEQSAFKNWLQSQREENE